MVLATAALESALLPARPAPPIASTRRVTSHSIRASDATGARERDTHPKGPKKPT